MESEVKREVFEYVEGQRIRGNDRSATEWLKKLNVPDADGMNYEYSWKRHGDPSVICTIWSEFIQVDRNGRWFAKERIEAEAKLGGGERSPMQKRRAKSRIELLKFAFEKKQPVIALLQINRKSIEELENNENASTSVRVRDEQFWYVVGWNERDKEAWLVRGELWDPTVKPLVCPVDAWQNDSSNPEDELLPGADEDSNFGFPDAEARKKIETAAIDFVTLHYESKDYRVESREDSNVGYDLDVFDPITGKLVAAIEVKGTSGGAPNFYITRNERACAAKLEAWQIAIVTNALDEPKLTILSAEEMEELFDFTVVAWRGTQRQ